MISSFLGKQKDIKRKKKLVRVMINSLNIPSKQKYLYIDALDVLDETWLDKLYDNMTRFVESLEKKEGDEINISNFASIWGLTKKEVSEKKKEENAFSFLINNL